MIATIFLVAFAAIALLWALYLGTYGKIGPKGDEFVFGVKGIDGAQAGEEGVSRGIAMLAAKVARERLADRRSLVRVSPENMTISVKIEGAASPEVHDRLKSRLTAIGRFGLHLVNSHVADIENISQGRPVPGFEPYVLQSLLGEKGGYYRRVELDALRKMNLAPDDWMGVGSPPKAVLLKAAAELDGGMIDVQSLHETKGGAGNLAIGFAFKSEHRKEFADLTERNIGRHLAIVMDDVLYVAPVIQARISGPAVIDLGQGSKPEELREIMLILSSGEMPAKLEFERFIPYDRGGR